MEDTNNDNKGNTGTDALPEPTRTDAQTARAKRMAEQLQQIRQKAAAVEKALAHGRAERVERTAKEHPELYKRIVLLLVDSDWSSTTGFSQKTTPEEVAALRKDVENTEGGLELYNSLNAEWEGLRRYAHFTKTSVYYPYLLEVGQLLAQLHNYDALVQYVGLANAFCKVYREKYNMDFNDIVGFLGETPKEVLCDPSRMPEPYRLRATDEREIIAAIKRQAKKVAKNMAEVKSFIDAAFEYLGESRLPLPYYLEEILPTAILNNTTERIKFAAPDKYFKGLLNYEVKEKGYTPTPEEERLAVVPDYEELKPDKHAYQYAKRLLYEYTTPEDQIVQRIYY